MNMENGKNKIMETILHRRAIRRFEEKQIGEDALQQILQAGLYPKTRIIQTQNIVLLP